MGEVRFTSSARRHKVGRARVLAVLDDPIAVVVVPGSPERVLVLGEDWTGRALEVVIVIDGDDLVVIHAMDLRTKYRGLYEEGRGL
jgi:hypothetical protein